MTTNRLYYLIALLLCVHCGWAQKSDTLKIDASKVNTRVLNPGTHQYLVYFKNGKDSSRVNYQFWSRTIEFIRYKNQDAISVTQVWEDNKSVFHKVYSVCDRKTFAPLYQQSWWKGRGENVFDFLEGTASVNGVAITEADTAKRLKNAYGAFKKALGQYTLNWHLDLEVFPTLPYKNGVTFLINFYDPGFPEPAYQAYTVTGSGKFMASNREEVDCWLLTHESSYGKEVFWISKKTKEVLKLEQAINTGMYRFKIKLPASP